MKTIITRNPRLVFDAITQDMPNDHWMIEKYDGNEFSSDELRLDIETEIELASENIYRLEDMYGNLVKHYKIALPQKESNLKKLEEMFRGFLKND